MKNPPQKVIFITGCSSGFGLLTALRCATSGFQVIATMRDLNKQNDLLELASEVLSNINIKQCDVTDTLTIQKTVDETMKEYGRIDVLVNNAGYGIGGCFEDLTEEDIRRQMDVNFFGVQNVTRIVLPIMRQQKSGKIINLSSSAGLIGYPCFGAYNASKWALEGFSESLFYEVKPFGIDVILLEPGLYPTKILTDNALLAKNFFNEKSPYFEFSKTLKHRVDSHFKKNKKNPQDIADLIVALIKSDKPSLRNIPDRSTYIAYCLRKFLPFKWFSYLFQKAL